MDGRHRFIVCGWWLVVVALAPATRPGAAERLAVVPAVPGAQVMPGGGVLARRVGAALESGLAELGYQIYDAAATTGSRPQGNAGAVLIPARLTAPPPLDALVAYAVHVEVVKRTYTARATIGIEVGLIELPSGRRRGRLDVRSPRPVRVPHGCAADCLTALLSPNAVRNARGLVPAIHQQLRRIAAFPDRAVPAETPAYLLEFRGFEPAWSAEIEDYLSVFPGYRGHARAQGRSQALSYRYISTAPTEKVAAALEKMLDHLGVAATVDFRRDSIRVRRLSDASAANRHSRDW